GAASLSARDRLSSGASCAGGLSRPRQVRRGRRAGQIPSAPAVRHARPPDRIQVSASPPTVPTGVAYLINRYPAVSHSFIRREILALERQGIEVQRIALRDRKSTRLNSSHSQISYAV